VIARHVKGLEGDVTMSLLDPYRDERGWRFSGGRFEDPVNDFEFLHQAYECTVPGYDDRVSVPVLWDKHEHRIVSNESHDILRMFDSAFEGASGPELYPQALRHEIDAVNDLVYENVNNGVYRAGFASSQEAYEEAFTRLFDALAQLEQRLAGSRYLVGDAITEADWRLFPSLVRFDEVYHVHFRCNGRRLIDHPNLWGYARAVPAAGHRGDRGDGRDQAPLLHDARLAEPEAHHPARAARRRLGRAARPRVMESSLDILRCQANFPS
jgi:putative glutathione S-transferase